MVGFLYQNAKRKLVEFEYRNLHNQLMANILILPWTTVGAERNFSPLARIMCDSRARLTTCNLENLLFF